jgi:type II secretory pathway component HofQ
MIKSTDVATEYGLNSKKTTIGFTVTKFIKTEGTLTLTSRVTHDQPIRSRHRQQRTIPASFCTSSINLNNRATERISITIYFLRVVN